MNDNITEINKDTFWALIQEAKDTCGQDTDAWAKYMIDRLAGLGPDQSLMFLNYMDAYKDLSFRYGLWDAAKIFRVDGCSDDSFSYFRSWLIVQGKDVYMAALADPDSLADVEPYADCFFETAGYVGAYAGAGGRDQDERPHHPGADGPWLIQRHRPSVLTVSSPFSRALRTR